MSWWKPSRSKQPHDAQFDAEVNFHLEELVRANIEAGMTPVEARRQAVLEFGGAEQIKEEIRDVHRLPVIDTASRNLKSAFRFMRRSPSFSATIILTLALGIGSNSAVFSALDTVLLRALPYPNAGRLVILAQHDRKSPGAPTAVAPIRLEDWNRLNSTFTAISGYYYDDSSETSGTLPEKVTQSLVAPRFFDVLGVAPALGREFTPAEQRFGGPSAILISDSFWRRRFGADPAAVGKSLRFGTSAYTIVGVMPPSFVYPSRETDAWTTSPADGPYARDRNSTWYTVVGRLKPGISLAQARANMAAVQSNLGREFPKPDANFDVQITTLKETIVGEVRRSVWMLYGAVSLLLLIACTNIAALLLARATERRHEIAIRLSLGASRTVIACQLLTETLVLALVGGALGLGVATGASRVFRALAGNLPRIEELRLDWRLVIYTLLCAVVTTLLCGLFPALHATRSSLSGSMSQGGRTQVSGRSPLQWLLVGVQVALAVTLLAGAGLFIRSFQALGNVTPGFDTSHVLTLHVSASWGETVDMKALTQRIDRILAALRAVPGVDEAATSALLPGVPNKWETEVRFTGGPAGGDDKMLAESRVVSTGYFSAMRIPMLAGEPCSDSYGNPLIVVNRSFVNRYLDGGNAIGRHLEMPGNNFVKPAEIRGVAADAREQGINHEPVPTVYWCMSAPFPDPFYLIRTHADPMTMAETLRRKIHEVEPQRSVFGIKPLEEHLGDAFAGNRLRAVLLAFFAFTAVALVCVGIYGTLSYFVNVRQREVGLRLALGAERGQVARQFLFEGLGVSMAGCIVGLVLAAAFARLIAGMLFGVSPSDAVTLVAVTAIVLLVSATASLAPAIRAARVEPMQVLRNE